MRECWLRALRGLDFKMTHARQLIEAVQHAGAPDTLEAFVQAALRATQSPPKNRSSRR